MKSLSLQRRIHLLFHMEPVTSKFTGKSILSSSIQKIRNISRLLNELRKIKQFNLQDALKLKYFESLVAATKTVAKYNALIDKFVSPTYAINMDTYLKYCAEIAIVFALKRGDCRNNYICRTRSSFENLNESYRVTVTV